MSDFGKIISDARKEKGLSQKQLAEKVKKENGESISPQYLNDIEHNRRKPPGEFLIGQFAKVLGLPKEFLILTAGVFPKEEKNELAKMKPKEVAEAFRVFRKKIRGD